MRTWDHRYDRPDYLFGTAPAAFLERHIGVIPPASTVLAIADGEGRNSVYLAQRGHQVTAFDTSTVALEKARALALTKSVTVRHEVGGIEDWDWSRPYDCVLGIFIQFATPEQRATLFQDMKRATAPGGLILLHGYRPEQVDYGTGGPPSRENMYTEGMLRDAFSDCQILHLSSYDAVIEEGVGHSGRSALIDLIARKPEAA
jgi:SAM-dependent methyltransferase